MRMAPVRKFAFSQAKEQIDEDDPDERVNRNGRKGSSAKFSQGLLKIKSQSGQDRYSFGHLAKTLINGGRDQILDAVDRLKGKGRVLFELACFSNFSYARLGAIKNMSGNHEVLADVAKYCFHDETRASAVDELARDNEALADVAMLSHFKDSRLAALALIGNQNLLVKVAAQCPYAETRISAFDRITDSAAFQKLVEEAQYKNIRSGALKKISMNMHALRTVLLTSRRPEVRKESLLIMSSLVEALDDPEILVEIAKEGRSQDARYLAVGKLWRHPHLLRKVVSASKYKDARSTAIMLLSDMVQSLNDSELLAEVATSSPYADCRATAVGRLVGMSSALLSVANKSKYRVTRGLAVEKLKGDAETLKSVMKLSRYKDTRMAAYKLASSPEVFNNHLVNILG